MNRVDIPSQAPSSTTRRVSSDNERARTRSVPSPSQPGFSIGALMTGFSPGQGNARRSRLTGSSRTSGFRVSSTGGFAIKVYDSQLALDTAEGPAWPISQGDRRKDNGARTRNDPGNRHPNAG